MNLQHIKEKVTNLGNVVTELKGEVSKLKRKEQHRRFMLIMGSVAFNFINATLQTVFGRDKYFKFKKIRQLSCFEDIEAFPKSDVEGARWADFKKTYWHHEYFDEVLELLRAGRLELAHPTSIDEDDEEPPTPAQLQMVVTECYKSRHQKELRQQINTLIDDLDAITRRLGRPILE